MGDSASVIVVQEVGDSPRDSFSDLPPASGREALRGWHLDLDGVDVAAVARPVGFGDVTTRKVAFLARCGEDRRRHDAMSLGTQVVAQTVRIGTAHQVLEASFV